MESNLKELIDNKSLKWIFVGGKGGVGKTTSSSSIAIRIAQDRAKVLIISTDPAHNLSDAFNQQLSDTPTPIKGFTNLYGMEIKNTLNSDTGDSSTVDEFFKKMGADISGDFIREIISSVPGIDEAIAFGELIKTIDEIDNCTIVFDTAPTGHTLRFLNFPTVIEKLLTKLLQLKDKFEPLIRMASMAMASQTTDGTKPPSFDDIFDKIKEFKR